MTSRLPRSTRAAAVLSVTLSALALPAAQETVAPSQPKFTVPAGFEVVRVAGPPLVDRPIVADFDEQGRLYVADASGTNDKVEKQLADRPHRIVRLEDKDGDGVFDTSVVFADRMMLPQGAMWFDGSLYVGAPPSIWKLTDTNDDGVADRREEWFAGKTLTGCANDLHGPYLGPDGWIYWTKGAFAEQTYERPGKPPLVTRAAHIFRRRPGETLVEPVITGGMDNPVDVAFTPSGEAMLTATFLEHPQLGRRDAFIHAVYGGLFGKPHGVIDGHPQTGDLMPPVSNLGPAAVSGLTSYASRTFGEGYRGNFFAALFNMQKVTRHVLEPSGATFKSRDSDFLVADSLDFHPTDVLEDADGSLLVVDTGAWYKLCCPTSQLAKPDVLGAIYRVRRRGVAPVQDPRGLKIPWATLTASELTARLDDARPAVQRRAIHQLAKLEAHAVPALDGVVATGRSAAQRRNAVWALTRIATTEARAAVRTALGDADQSVRLAALHSVGVWRDADAAPQLLDALGSRLPAVRRGAAEALGRTGDPRAVPALLTAAALPLDRVGEHSVTYALIEVADPESTSAGLKSSSLQTQRAALLALDQMPNGGLQAATVVALLESPDQQMRDTAWRIAARHQDWGVALAGYFQQRMAEVGQRAEDQEQLQQRLAQFGTNAAIQQQLGGILGSATPHDVRATALRAMATSRVKELPEAWLAPLVRAMSGGEPDIAQLAVAVARSAPASPSASTDLQAALLRVARDSSRPTSVRLEALGSLSKGLPSVEADLFALLRDSLDPSQPVALRTSAAAIVEKARLDRDQLQALVELVRHSGPLELPRILPAFDQGSDEALGLAMLAALEQAPGRSNVRPDVLRPRLAKYPPSVQASGEALLALLQADSVKQAQRLDQLVAGMVGGGDIRRGQSLFNSPKGACASCHAIGYRGGKLGPDLTSIGQIRSERDLLEAIVFPNASFVRGYEPLMVTTTAGAVHSGVLKAERPDELVLTIGESQEARIPRAQVADMQPGAVSVMPTGYGDQLSRQELADLLAFLKGTKWGAN
ncbi:MAG: HEAT repeat domain-containing protein [Vicinamibacteria bacterium]|nr:HEAT repeat domain-containing protein [Vicinamibacteria bacterium]